MQLLRFSLRAAMRLQGTARVDRKTKDLIKAAPEP